MTPTRTLTLGLALSSLTLAACGGEATVYCARGVDGCRCAIEAFDLERDEMPVESCDEVVPEAEGGCCHDLAVTGTSTYCQCVEYACWRTASECSCGVFLAPPEGAERVAACAVDATFDQCCWGYGYPCDCVDNDGTPLLCSTGRGDVDACPSARTYLEGHCEAQIASSCAGIEWEPPESGGFVIDFPF